MTRALALAALASLFSAWLVAVTALPANAGGRPCHRGTSVSSTGMLYRYDGPSMTRRGDYRMAYRRILGSTLRYYTCTPKGR